MSSGAVADGIAAGRRARALRRLRITVGLGVAVGVLFTVSLMVGHTFYPLGDVARVVFGGDVPGASFTVGQLRLPRAVLAVLVGACFGIAGVSFQTLLRNQLASPDIIGISAGASAVAVYAIVMLGLPEATVSALAIVGALATALAIYLLAYWRGASVTRLILVGIALSAMLRSIVSYVLVRAAEWDLQVAMRWLTGSLNNATWDEVRPVAFAVVVLVPILLWSARDLEVLRHGPDSAQSLGVRVGRTQVVVILSSVALLAFATAATGPIAFVSLLAGPIAFRIVGAGGSLLLPSALVGMLLVLGSDLVGQWAFDTRYPVGVVTGALGAPFLIYLLVRVNRIGGVR